MDKSVIQPVVAEIAGVWYDSCHLPLEDVRAGGSRCCIDGQHGVAMDDV